MTSDHSAKKVLNDLLRAELREINSQLRSFQERKRAIITLLSSGKKTSSSWSLDFTENENKEQSNRDKVISEVIQVIRDNKNKPVRGKQIFKEFAKRGLAFFEDSQNPQAHLAAILSYGHNKNNCELVRLQRGLYGIRNREAQE